MSRRFLIAILSLAFLASAARVTFAQTASDSSTPLLIPCDQTDVGTPGIKAGTDCTISDFFNQFIILAQWGQTLVVSLGLLMMIYGGFQWITAAGRASKVQEGQRVIIGTLVGIAISFTAYIIINFSIAAITGTQTKSLNPFAGPIATVFGGKAEEQPFAGNGTPLDNINNCHDRWDNSCHDQIYCADVSDKSGQVRNIQQKLNGYNCICGTPDGCYGAKTAVCVRRFQIANDLPPTGELDDRTEGLLNGASAKYCTNDPGDTTGTLAAQVNAVNKLLPTPSVEDAQVGDRDVSGCCVIRDSSNNDVFCADQVSQRTCASLGSSNRFVADVKCDKAPETKTICGICYGNNKCFGLATQNWCSGKVSPAMSFTAQTGLGNPLCNNGYSETLHTIAP